MKYLKRDLYLKRIEVFIEKPIVKILAGMRRVGKSELLKQIAEKIDKKRFQIVYINKELREFDFIRTGEDLNKYIDTQINSSKKTALLIDEVQEIENWEKSINSYLAEGMDIYVTGSNAHLLSSDLATLISGRYVEFKIYNLSFSEFIQMGELENNSQIESFNKFIKYGGLPGVFHLDFDETAIFQFLDAIKQTIILKDVIKKNSIRNIGLLENLIAYVFDNIGNIFNASNVVKYLKNQHIQSNVPTIQNHIQYLIEPYIIHKVRRYDIKGKCYFDTSAKYYVGDLGLRHSLLGFQENDISGILENIIFLELSRNNYTVSFGKINDKEIDFIARKNDELIYIQVAYIMETKETQEREFSALEKIKDNHPKYVISMDQIPIVRDSGIKHLNLYDFLSNGFK